MFAVGYGRSSGWAKRHFGLGLHLKQLGTELSRRLGRACIGSEAEVLHTLPGTLRRLLWPKSYPSYLAASFSSVHQLVGIEIIFRYLGTFPSLHELLVIQGVQAVALQVVLENIFGHLLDIQISMVVLQPEIVS